MINGILLHLGRYLKCIFQCLRNITEELIHLCGGFHPLLLAVQHAVGVLEVMVGAEADQAVMCLCVCFIHKVYIIGADKLDSMLACQFNQLGLYLLLQLICLMVGHRHCGLVAL